MKRGFLGIQFSEAPKGYRKRRLFAFLIDMAILLIVLTVCYNLTGKPDYPAASAAMGAVRAEGDTENTQALVNTFSALFDAAYFQTLIIWLAWEAAWQVILKGASLGKFFMGLRIMPINPDRRWPLHYLLMTIRTLIKMVFIYIFQGLPFFIALLSILVTQKSQAGYDVFVKTYVRDLRAKSADPESPQ